MKTKLIINVLDSFTFPKFFIKEKHIKPVILLVCFIFFATFVFIYHYFYGHFFKENTIISLKNNKIHNTSSTKNKEGLQHEKQWHEYIDVIYYINLDTRKDRNDEFLKEMQRMNVPKHKIIRISAVSKPGKGDWGCSLSHLITIQQFVDSGLTNCIIFEDDFIFKQDSETVNTMFRDVFETSIVYDVIMLSANEIDTANTEYQYLKKVKDAQTTSGYIVNKHFSPILLQNYREGSKLIEESYKTGKSDNLQGPVCVDQYWKRLQPQSNWYMFSPKLGIQRESHSDIQGGVVNYGV